MVSKYFHRFSVLYHRHKLYVVYKPKFCYGVESGKRSLLQIMVIILAFENSTFEGKHGIFERTESLGVHRSAAGQGFEPRYADPESAVLPLDDPAIKYKSDPITAKLCLPLDDPASSKLASLGGLPLTLKPYRFAVPPLKILAEFCLKTNIKNYCN